MREVRTPGSFGSGRPRRARRVPEGWVGASVLGSQGEAAVSSKGAVPAAASMGEARRAALPLPVMLSQFSAFTGSPALH